MTDLFYNWSFVPLNPLHLFCPSQQSQEKELFFFFFFSFWLHGMACGILVPQPEIEPVPSALEVWSLNHWTREVLRKCFFIRGMATAKVLVRETHEK